MSHAYRADLAYIHHEGFRDFAMQAAPGLFDILWQHKITSGLVVDLGCGSGVWAQELVRAGYHVLGIDISPAMITLARKHAPRAKFLRASFLQADLPSCAAVTSLGECLNYLFDRKNNRQALAQLFKRVYQSLLPGGVFVFDLLEPEQWRNGRPPRRFVLARDWAVLVQVEENSNNHLLTRHISSFRRLGKLYRRSEETHQIRLYRSAEIAASLRRAGFAVKRLRGYGEMRFARGHVGFLARKPALSKAK